MQPQRSWGEKSGISQQFGDKFATFSTSREAAIFIV